MRRTTISSVPRLRRDVLRRSSVGLLLTNRSVSMSGTGTNQSYGIDGTFAFFENLEINTYWAKTDTDGLVTRENTSYRAQLDYSGDRHAVQLERLRIGDSFNPEMGFLRRDDMARDYARFRFSPRPRGRSAIRKYVYEGWVDTSKWLRALETRERAENLRSHSERPDRFAVNYTNRSSSCRTIPDGVTTSSCRWVPTSSIDRVGYTLAQQRPLSANLFASSVPSTRPYDVQRTRGRGADPNQLQWTDVSSTTSLSCRYSHSSGPSRDLFDDPAVFVERAAPTTLDEQCPTNARFMWSTGPAASCSSCTTTNAHPDARVPLSTTCLCRKN